MPAAAEGRSGSLTVVGSGIRPGLQLTQEARVRIERADIVLHLLAEVGPHVDLIAMNGRYAEMFTAWQKSHEAHVFEA